MIKAVLSLGRAVPSGVRMPRRGIPVPPPRYGMMAVALAKCEFALAHWRCACISAVPLMLCRIWHG